ncbi:MAG: DoxX family protein [Bacteroidales bacterium]|nr:DoxX family protein [Candidatus Cryptobacteroides caccocaballi]
MRYFLRILLGAVFCASAISKLFFMESFELYVFSFQLFSFDLCSFAARLLVACELVLGLGLISGIWRRTINWLCAATLGGFSLFLMWRIILGDDSSCHCFGDVLDMNPWQSLLKNAVLALLLFLGWKAPEHDIADFFCSRFPKFRTSVCRILIACLLSAASFTAVFAICPPSFYHRWTSRTQNLSQELWQPFSDDFGYSEGNHIVLFFSPLCEHCQHCAAKVNSILARHDLDHSRIHVVFMDLYDDPSIMDRAIPYFYEQAGIDELPFDSHKISYEDMIPMTDGVIPLVCLFADGRLVEEYSYSTLDESVFSDFVR